jgi:hypothetical protein
MLTLENSSPDSSVACAYYAKFFLTWGWLDQNSKTTGTPTINWPFRPVYGCSDIVHSCRRGRLHVRRHVVEDALDRSKALLSLLGLTIADRLIHAGDDPCGIGRRRHAQQLMLLEIVRRVGAELLAGLLGKSVQLRIARDVERGSSSTRSKMFVTSVA